MNTLKNNSHRHESAKNHNTNHGEITKTPESNHGKEAHPELNNNSEAVKSSARDKIEKLALSSEKHNTHKEAERLHHGNNHAPHHYLTRKVKNAVYHQSVENIQSHLSPTEKRLSSFMHKDSIETLSEVGAKTVARPNAVLGGGILMFIGGAFALFMSKRYGFELPLSLFISLYIVGFIVILFLDLIIQRVIAKRKSNNNY